MFDRVRSRAFQLFVWSGAAVLVVLPATAQAQQTGGVQGRVLGPDAAVVADARVQIVGTSIDIVTDTDGRFHVRGLEPGTHRVAISYLGLRPDTVIAHVTAASTADLTVRLVASAVALEGLEIVGQRRGQARALNQQRTALNIRNVIAQEQIERFPDANIADGLKRVPGVTVSQDYGEAAGVMVRGLSSSLNSVTINGERVPSNTIGGRGVNLGGILSDMVGGIEVHKALTPDMDADAIGGSINLITRHPRDGETILTATAASGYNEFQETPQKDFDLTFGRRVGKIGFLLGGSYLNSYRSEESLHYRWNDAVLEDFTLYNYELERERYALNGTLEYDFSGRSRAYVRAMYNRFDDRQYTPKFTHSLRGGDDLTASAVTNAPTYRTARQRNHALTTVTIAAGGAHPVGAARLDYSLSYARGGNDQPTYFNASWATTGDYSIDLSNREYPRVTPVNGTDPYRLSDYQLTGFSIETEETGDRNFTGAVNLELPFRNSEFAGAFRVGGKLRAKETFRVAQETAYSPAAGVVITMDEHPRNGFGNSSFYGSRYDFGGGYDPGSLSQYFRSNPGEFVGTYDYEKPMDEYDAHEEVGAAYGMVTATLGRLTALAGVRYEHTWLGYDGNLVQFDTDGSYLGTAPVDQEQSYGGFYPGIHLRFQLADNTNLRAAVTRSLARPAYSSLAPYELVLHEDNEIERGNPNLEPYSAVNYDLLGEHYLSNVGIIAGGFFYKDLGNVIVDRTYQQVGGPYDGYSVAQPQNGTGARVWGLEASWQQQLTFLPGPLSGLGVYLNYTYADSRMDVGDGEREIAVPGQIPHAANVAALYEKYGFSGSLSMNYQGRFIDDVGSSPMEDEYFGSRTQWDVSASQRLLRNVRVFAEVNNLTNEPYRFYVGPNGNGSIPLENAVYGRWGTIGLRYDL